MAEAVHRKQIRAIAETGTTARNRGPRPEALVLGRPGVGHPDLRRSDDEVAEEQAAAWRDRRAAHLVADADGRRRLAVHGDAAREDPRFGASAPERLRV